MGDRKLERVARTRAIVSEPKGSRPLSLELSRSQANNNDGDWWSASSPLSANAIERMFRDEKVPTVLYEVVGAIKTSVMPGHILLQLARNGWDIDVALSDLHISLQEQIRSAT